MGCMNGVWHNGCNKNPAGRSELNCRFRLTAADVDDAGCKLLPQGFRGRCFGMPIPFGMSYTSRANFKAKIKSQTQRLQT